MIAERPVVAIGTGFERGEFDFARRHFVKPTTDQVGMSADQTVVTRHLRLVAERRAVAAVEFSNLLEAEVFEREPRADVERRLIQIGDGQMSFGRVGDGERQPLPWPFRIERPFVMPGTEQPEDLAPEITGEETVYFIQTPDNRRRDLLQHAAPQIAFEVDARTEVGVPDLIRVNIQVELIGE